jgi:serine/threonine-protein kinase
VAEFEAALAEDPEYALAWAGLAQAYSVLPALGDYPLEEAATRGNEAAARALALNAQLAEAHAALGQMALNFEWDLASAERAYARAVEFNPGYATAHQWYAEALLLLGRFDEARTEIEEALLLDPLSPSALTVRGYVLAVRGEEEAALAAFRDLNLLYPSYPRGGMQLALLALRFGRRDDALGAAAGAAGGDAELAAAFRTIAGSAGSPSEREAAAAALAGVEDRLPASIAALWFAALGDGEGALQRIERAGAAQRDANLPLALVHPLLGPYRGDPRLLGLAESIDVVLPAAR